MRCIYKRPPWVIADRVSYTCIIQRRRNIRSSCNYWQSARYSYSEKKQYGEIWCMRTEHREQVYGLTRTWRGLHGADCSQAASCENLCWQYNDNIAHRSSLDGVTTAAAAHPTNDLTATHWCSIILDVIITHPSRATPPPLVPFLAFAPVRPGCSSGRSRHCR